MDLGEPTQPRGGKEIGINVIHRQCLALALVVGAHEILQAAGEFAALAHFPVRLDDGRAIAVGARDEEDVFRTDAVAQKAGEDIGLHEHAAHVPKVEILAPIRHSGGDDGAPGKTGSDPVVSRFRHGAIRHFPPSSSKNKKPAVEEFHSGLEMRIVG